MLGLLILFLHCSWSMGITKDYVVYLGGTGGRDPKAIINEHVELLEEVSGSSEGLICSFKHAFSGFGARLTKEQARALSANPKVVHVGLSRMRQLHTTRSWNFLTSLASTTPGPTYATFASTTQVSTQQAVDGSDIIIGVLDTGIWPESESFQETSRLGPIPSRWRGECVNGAEEGANAIICNRKLIGARFYSAGVDLANETYSNARDSEGHGTHTASTAAGNPVPNVSMEGFARGTARGGLPTARIACYKVCWSNGCSDINIAAAMDDALHDGVDVLSMSIPLGGGAEILAFHALERGVSVVASAGNHDRPTVPTVTNDAPWIFTIAATTIDRHIDISRGVTILPYVPAPVVPFFSSRGPSNMYLDIIKPDVAAPGVDILAAWPSNVPETFNDTSVFVNYTLMSGTSMSCPHVAGAMAFLKVVHPTWSPAALKSSLMTTAASRDNANLPIQDWNGEPANVFAMGSGLILPTRVVDPGLVYDAHTEDFILYLCSTGYTTTQVQSITGSNSTRCPVYNNSSGFDLNYPSIAWNRLSGVRIVSRVVTNVGPSDSIYEATVTQVRGLSITVEPRTLVFSWTGQKQRYRVTLSSNRSAGQEEHVWLFASIIWSDGQRVVRTPVAVFI